MAEIIYESASALLEYDKSGKHIVLKWKKNANSDEYRELFSNLVEFAKKNTVKSFVSDLRKEGHIGIEDLQWLDKQVLRIAGNLGIEKVAMITEDSLFSNIYAETIKRKLKEAPILVKLFSDPVSAKAWIEEDTPA